MLRIRKDYNLDNLKQFGFKLEPERSYYYYDLEEDVHLEVQKTKNDKTIEYGNICIDTQYGVWIGNLDILYDLILLGIVEKIEILGDKE